MLNNLKHALGPSALFFALSLPQLYGKTGSYLGATTNCPNVRTRLLHSLAFFVVTYLLTKYYDSSATPGHLVRYSVHSAMAFFVFSSPELYTLTETLLSKLNMSSRLNMGSSDCPSMTGIAVHTVVYGLFLSWVKSLE
jgi:hypothetical protein